MAAYQYIYVMKGLSKAYSGGRQVLSDIWLSFYPGAKIGVLGPNGAGKSTLLRIMAGQDNEYLGEAMPAPGIRIGFVEQEPQLDAKKSVKENVEDGVRNIRDLLNRYEAVSAKFAEPDADYEKLGEEQAKLQDAIDAAGAWDLDRK